ncbi:DUF4362 domain-containing protein [Lederbergia panacisoli]|uniref:DUF4362 domain-containing protein n=1 Tax=Lederbergia panacisoli TaxID=1255251 RepID=UPI00214B79C4|nr:DUF4362 domain-containing protein [Lederbergia panacisoli]MCR2822582.1 DUF4362 domain-containing protein [Lederbergia panacisoli]
MKKVIFINLLIILIFTLAACNTSEREIRSTGAYGTTHQPTKEGTKSFVKGVGEVDVLNIHGSIEGLERMKSFYDNMQNAVQSNLRIVHYTIEGAPIVTELTYNGESLEVKYDSTRDAFGSGEITTARCGNMVEEVNPTNTSYIAVDCKKGLNGMDEILEISYNVSQQDLFEFHLQYGMNKENEINTKTNIVKKGSNVSDFVIPASIKQEVYKRLVFANYLTEKDLKIACESNELKNYYLKVFINGGEQELAWAACDRTPDGVKLTKIAEYIIKQSEKHHSENHEITVQGYVLQIKDNTLLIGEDLNRLDYEWLKDEIDNLDAYIFDFVSLEGLNTGEFKIGDKIKAIIEGNKRSYKLGSVKVKEIHRIDVY